MRPIRFDSIPVVAGNLPKKRCTEINKNGPLFFFAAVIRVSKACSSRSVASFVVVFHVASTGGTTTVVNPYRSRAANDAVVPYTVAYIQFRHFFCFCEAFRDTWLPGYGPVTEPIRKFKFRLFQSV